MLIRILCSIPGSSYIADPNLSKYLIRIHKVNTVYLISKVIAELPGTARVEPENVIVPHYTSIYKKKSIFNNILSILWPIDFSANSINIFSKFF